MTLLLLLRPSKSSGDIPPPAPPRDNGWYVYGPNDPKPSRRSMRGKRRAKYLTVDEIDTIKHFARKEEQELVLIHLRTGEYDWEDDEDDDD